MPGDDDTTKRLEEVGSLLTLLQDDELAAVILSFLSSEDLCVFDCRGGNAIAAPEVDFRGPSACGTAKDVVTNIQAVLEEDVAFIRCNGDEFAPGGDLP